MQYLLLEASAAATTFSLSMVYCNNTAVPVLHDSAPITSSSPPHPALASFAFWVPSETTGALQSITLAFTNVTYHWTHNHTVAAPITVYCGYSATLQALDVASSSAVISTTSAHYDSAFTIKLQRTTVTSYLLIAVETQGTAGFTLTPTLAFSPFLLTPSTPIKGDFSTYQTLFNSFVFLYSPQYTPITIAVSKLSSDYRSLFPSLSFFTSSSLLVSNDHYPTYDDYDWIARADASIEPITVNVTLSRNHPKFCNKCNSLQTP